MGGLGMLMWSISSLDKLHVHFWVAFVAALLPAIIFAFVTTDFLSERVVKPAQWFAIAWYFAVALVSLLIAAYRGFERSDAFFVIFVALGAWPCIVAIRALRGLSRHLPTPRAQFHQKSFENEIVFRANRMKAFLMLLVSMGFVAIGFFMRYDEPFLGWATICFFGLGIPVFSIMLIPGLSYLKLDRSGFEICSFWRKHMTQWADVVSFELISIQRTKMIGIHYRPGYARQKLGRAISSTLSRVEGGVPCQYKISAQEQLSTMEAWHARYSRSD